jgi:hypothetical protein
MDDLRVFWVREPPSYDEIRKSNGMELLTRMLYADMQD